MKSLNTCVKQSDSALKNVFEDAKAIAKEVKEFSLTEEHIFHKFRAPKCSSLSEGGGEKKKGGGGGGGGGGVPEQRKVAELIYSLTPEARDEFINLVPRFWTQGSFQYDTLNKPFQAPQEKWILMMVHTCQCPFFESEPMVGHTLLILLVDASLKSLAKENPGWTFYRKANMRAY